MRAVLEDATEFARIVAVETASGFYRGVVFAAEVVAVDAGGDVDGVELQVALRVLRNFASQGFAPKSALKLATAVSTTAARPTAAAPLYLTTPLAGMLAVSAPWLKM